jgi:diguanylate cyclase (GGDEF)-like protein
MTTRRSTLFAAIGCALGLGSPGGWLLLRLAAGSHVANELRASGSLYLYLLVATCAVFALFGHALGRLADEREELLRQMRELSLTDALTTLRNSRDFHQRLGEETARAKRAGTPLSLIVIDIDSFKAVNDQLGHPAGDEALRQIAGMIRDGVREGDVPCRIGGEEFAVICPSAVATRAAEIAERLRAAIADHAFALEGVSRRITASLGVAERRPEMESLDLFRSADQALYRAKESGRNAVAMAGS